MNAFIVFSLECGSARTIMIILVGVMFRSRPSERQGERGSRQSCGHRKTCSADRRAKQQAPTAPSRVHWLPKTLRAKANSTSHFNAIWGVQIGAQKYSA
jgi:hypothetical protein